MERGSKVDGVGGFTGAAFAADEGNDVSHSLKIEKPRRFQKLRGFENITDVLNRSVRIEFFEIIGHPSDDTASQCAVNHPVVVGVGKEHFMADADSVTVRGFDYSGFLLNSPQGDDPHLRLHDDGSTHHIPERTDI